MENPTGLLLQGTKKYFQIFERNCLEFFTKKKLMTFLPTLTMIMLENWEIEKAHLDICFC